MCYNYDISQKHKSIIPKLHDNIFVFILSEMLLAVYRVLWYGIG